MTVDSQGIREKIKELNDQLAPLREQRDKLDNEAEQWTEKRDKTRQEIKELQAEIADLKQQRDEINQKVKDLKIIRDQLIQNRKEKLAKVLEYKQKLASLKQNPTKAIQAVRSEIRGLEWKIQTSSLTVPQEKRIIEQISELEKQLASYKQAQLIWKEINTLQQQLRALHTDEKNYHKQITEQAEQSRQIHQTIQEKGVNIPQLKADADENHEKFIETKKQAQQLDKQCMPLRAQIRALLIKVKSEEKKKKTQRETELMQELEKKALEKVKRGKRLTWEEFQILAEKGLTET